MRKEKEKKDCQALGEGGNLQSLAWEDPPPQSSKPGVGAGGRGVAAFCSGKAGAEFTGECVLAPSKFRSRCGRQRA